MKTRRRFQAMLLVCFMLFTLLPTTVFAATATCPYCDVTCSYTVGYDYWTKDIHSIRHWCSNCGLAMCEGANSESHTFSNGICTKCGYDNGTGTTEPAVCYHTSTYRSWNICDWWEYCSDCGEFLGSGTSHGPFIYGSWEYLNTIEHRRSYSCPDCGEGGYSNESHSPSTVYIPDDSTRHQVKTVCYTCDGTVSTGYADHTDSDSDDICDMCGYGMSCFSVTVPAVMMLAVSPNGAVSAATNAVIINNSTAAVTVSGITILSADGWTLVPYDTNMANEKVNANLIGFRIGDICTRAYGSSETFAGNWTVDCGCEYPLSYDAVVSAASRAMTAEQVLTVIFVIGWAA